jgi:hypothetical protein
VILDCCDECAKVGWEPSAKVDTFSTEETFIFLPAKEGIHEQVRRELKTGCSRASFGQRCRKLGPPHPFRRGDVILASSIVGRDGVESVGHSLENLLETNKFSQETFVVTGHDVFLTCCNSIDSVLERSYAS